MAESSYRYSDSNTDSGGSTNNSRTSSTSSYSDSPPEDRDGSSRFYITRESQENLSEPTRKWSYAGHRDLSDLNKIQELDIVAPDGSIRGIKNRVRAGLANFENPVAIEKKKKEEGRILVYLTSFRGVRSTYEDCKYVQTVLHNFRVKVEEKDIYLNKIFYKELEDRLGEDGYYKLPVPQVFISGQRIGGKEEIEELNETGELRRLLETFKHQETAKNCAYCGGYEFIPCRKCRGSKDSVKNPFTNEFKALRCTHCNENGLEQCPGCSNSTDGGDMWNEEELRKWREKEEFERQEEKERRKLEKRERIKREALEAEFQKQLKKERELAEKQRMRKEKKKKRIREAAAANKIAEDIAMELEKERQWREEQIKINTS